MKILNRKRILLFAAVLALTFAAVHIPGSLAYFTDHESAKGQADVKLSWSTHLDEQVKDNNKHVVVENTGDTDAMVRVAVFAGDFATVKDEDGKWQKRDGWYYYKEILKPGEKTSELFVEVKVEEASQADFNIMVVHESARVVYIDNSTPYAPKGWTVVPEV